MESSFKKVMESSFKMSYLIVSDSTDLALRRSFYDCLTTLPIVLYKNRKQAGCAMNPVGVITFSGTYALSTLSGYALMSYPVWGGVAAGVVSAGFELMSRPMLTSHRPNLMATSFLSLREVGYWSGLSVSNSLLDRETKLPALAVQTVSCCVVCNTFDVLLAKSIVHNWKSFKDAKTWTMRRRVDFGHLIRVSAMPRLLSGVVIPILILSNVV